MKRALITGVTGQDGSYLAERLLAHGYQVYGLVRRTSTPGRANIAHLDGLVTVEGDVLDQGSLWRAFEDSRPDEIYHLAAQSFVGRSWREPIHTLETTGLSTVRMLEAMRVLAPNARFYQASSSEMFGSAPGPYTPEGPFQPRSPYAIAKVTAHLAARNYRESYGLYVAAGVLFNHESPRRGPEFVTRKICIGAARASRDPGARLKLGNLDARRDWGWAPDYVEAMHALLQLPEPVDLIVGTGVSHSVRQLCEIAYGAVGLDWTAHVELDATLARPAEVPALVADPSEAERLLGWKPRVGFREMVERMVRAEVDRL